MIFVEPIFRDLQQQPINGYCRICGGELYEDEEWICRDCKGIVSQIVIQGYDFLEIKEES